MKMYALLFFSAMLQVVAAEREMVGGINPLIGAVTHSESGRHWEMFDRRIGLFLHWGIYSVNGWHEQEEMRRRVNRAEYEKSADRFVAQKFDADTFVRAAEILGADYIVFTAKHHDGFCMWNTGTTSFNVMNTPCGRDVLKEIANACRRRGMKLGLYYSNPDWHHPNAYNPKSTHQIAPSDPRDRPDIEAYRRYVRAQVTELLTGYGEIVCFFWDIPTQIEDRSMNDLVRKLQPGIKINDRGWSKGDYSTPERGIPEGAAFTNLTEACDSVGAESWGYRANEDYRTVGYLTRAADRILSMGGNYLLNVGPKPDGAIPNESMRLLTAVGSWYAKVRESFCNVETDFNAVADDSCFVTRRGQTIYCHYPKGLSRTGVNLRPFNRLPSSCILLNTGKPLACELVDMPSCYRLDCGKVLHLTGIPADELSNESVVIKIEFNGN
jgi:alpha-L-fucosidase